MENNQRKTMVNIDDLPLNQQMRMTRLHHGLTQKQLVQLLMLPCVSFVCRMETGKKPIPQKYVERIEAFIYEGRTLTGSLKADRS